jgi:UDP-N-acetylmuramoyl-tripeptide--D-alanyl-D-alanine ligase
MSPAAPLWSADELRDAVGGSLVPACAVSGVSIDSRTVRPGDLFVALRDARDGHAFVGDALARGAACAMVDHDPAGVPADAHLLRVADTLRGLTALGAAGRERFGGRVVAVTGSVGKTGTKEMLRLLLGALGETHAAVASYNNHWGVPLTLARMRREAAFGVFEIGMNHPGEIAPLTAQVRPHVAVVTTVEPVHIEFFRSVSAIADAKGEIFGGLEPGGAAVLPRDNPHFERLRAHALASPAGRVVSFGEHSEADVRAERIVLKADLSYVEARVHSRSVAYRLGSPGRHVALNSLAVLAAVHVLGGDLSEAAASLADLQPPVGRGERTALSAPDGPFTLVDESFNANPASMRAALANLAAVEPGPRGRRVAVLGDMLELGPDGPAHHRALLDAVEASGADLVFAVGPLMRGLHDAIPPERRGGHTDRSDDLQAAVLDAVRAGDVVMVKGSKGIWVSRIVAALKRAYAPRSDLAAAGR